MFFRRKKQSPQTGTTRERADTLSNAFLHARGGRPPIQDEFTALPLSPDKKLHLRRKRDGLCVMCGGARPCHRHSKNREPTIARKRGRETYEWAALPGVGIMNRRNP